MSEGSEMVKAGSRTLRMVVSRSQILWSGRGDGDGGEGES